MKVAVIGAGNWGQNLVRTLHRLQALAAVVDSDEPRRRGVTEQYPDVPVFANYESVFREGIDAVVIATPAHTHCDVARAALQAGKDVFVEKPFTLSVAGAEALVKLAEMHGRVLMVGHMLLYQPAIQWIRKYIHAGELGTICSFHQERLNLGRVRSVENVLWSFGVHDIAVLLSLVGVAPSEVTVTGHNVLQADIADDVYLHMRFPQNVAAHLHVSWLWPERERRLVVVGSTGMLVYDELEQTVTLHRKWVDSSLAARTQGTEVVFRGSGEPLTLELQAFLEAIASRRPPLSDGRSAIEVMRVLERTTPLLTGVGR